MADQVISIQTVLNKHYQSFLSIRGVVGIAEGKRDGESCIIVMVSEHIPAIETIIPKSLDGYRTIVEVQSELQALPENKRVEMYGERADYLRDAAAYEMQRILAVPSGSDNQTELFRGDQFEVSLSPRDRLRFFRIEPGSYREGFSPKLKDQILSIRNRSNDLDTWAGMLDTTDRGLVTIEYPYYVSETIITNRMYAAFVAETGYRTIVSRYRTGWYVDENAQWREGIANEFHMQPRPMSEPDHPATLVSWFDAMNFALWASEKAGMPMRMPTKEEWILAARPAEKSDEICIFPWGNDLEEIDRRMNFATSELEGYKWIYEQYSDGYAFTSPVFAYPPNERGLYDMLGNVWVWNFTDMNSYESRPSGDRIAGVPKIMETGAHQNEVMTMQGGCYLARLTHANLYSKMGHPAMEGACDIGFRLVAVAEAHSGMRP